MLLFLKNSIYCSIDIFTYSYFFMSFAKNCKGLAKILHVFQYILQVLYKEYYYKLIQVEYSHNIK